MHNIHMAATAGDQIHFPHLDLREENIVPDCKKPGQVDPYRVFGAIGPKGGGKSTLVFNLAYRFQHLLDTVIAITPNGRTRDRLGNIMPKENVHKSWPPGFERLMHQIAEEEDDSQKTPFMLIIDDMQFNKAFMTSDLLQFIVTQTRHLKACVVIIFQDIRKIIGEIKSNIDYLFALADDNERNLDLLQSYFFGGIKKARFLKYFMWATQGRRMLVADKVSTDLTKKYYTFMPRIFEFFSEADLADASKEDLENMLPRFFVQAKRFKYLERKGAGWERGEQRRQEAPLPPSTRPPIKSDDGIVSLARDPMLEADRASVMSHKSHRSHMSHMSHMSRMSHMNPSPSMRSGAVSAAGPPPLHRHRHKHRHRHH